MRPPPSTRPKFAQLPDYERLCEVADQFPGLDPEVVTATAAVRGVGLELALALDANLAGYGMSEGRLRILGSLLLEQRPLTHTELAERSCVTRGTITGLVDCLERDGLVARRPDERDRRAMFVELTEHGRARLDEVLPGHLKQLAALMAGLSRTEQRQLVVLLLKVHAGLAALESEAGEAGPTRQPAGDREAGCES